jgi:glycosyltransferase involved in cell wall biosynthesis
MGQPQISIVIPVFNGERYLRQTLDSILAQDLTDFELLVIDDGSTDGTADILKEYSRDPRLRIHSQENQGLVKTRNIGLRMASCELLAFIDADDLAVPARMSLQAAYLNAHPDVAALGSHILYIDPEGRPLRTLRYPTGPEKVAAALQSHNALAQPAIMVRRSVALAVGGYRDAFKFGAEDYDLWLRMSESHAIDNLPEVLTHYRIHGESITHTRRAEQLIAAFAAMCSARRRRNGKADPVEGQDTPITEDDLVRYRLEPDERAAFLRIRIDVLRLRDARPEDYLELLAQSWELRPYLRRGRHVRHILMPAAFILLRHQRAAAGLGWIGRAMTREPLSATWLMLRQSVAFFGFGRKSA